MANDFETALTIYEGLASKSPKSLNFKIKEGESLLGLDRTDEAKEKFQQVLDQDKDNKNALAEWDQIMKDVKDIDLLDNLDAQILAVYCDALVQYRLVTVRSPKSTDDIKELQAWARIISTYADKLGFTPGARARLVKKRADEKKKDKFGSKFD